MLKILTVAVASLYAVAIIVEQVSSITETCIGEFCFTTPGSNVVKNFDDAKSWCNGNGSTLAVVNDSYTQAAFTQYLYSSNIGVMSFVNIKLYQNDNTWYLVNGSRYQGQVGNQQYYEYRVFCYLKPTQRAEFSVEASIPSDLRNYVCNFEGTKCLSNSKLNFLFMGTCYVKYENENLTWYQARERCIDYGGELAQFQSGSYSPFNTSWLNQSRGYWVGIRWSSWTWKLPDGNELIYSSWSNGKPNNINYLCVCVDPNGIPAWSWTDCDCSVQRPFVCLKIVPTTTVTTTTSTSTTTPTIATTATTLNTSDASPNKSEVSGIMIVGLVLGLGGILPLTIITVAVIICNVRLRRRFRENDRNDERVTTTTKTPKVNVEQSAARIDDSDPDLNYEYFKRDTILGPDNSSMLYDQISQPEEDVDYEVTP